MHRGLILNVLLLLLLLFVSLYSRRVPPLSEKPGSFHHLDKVDIAI